MDLLKKALSNMGVCKHSAYKKRYLNETNIRMAIYMSFIVLVLEFWMLVRYVYKRPGRTFIEYFDGETNYLIFFSAALVLMVFALRYTEKITRELPGKIVSVLVLALDISMMIRFIYRSIGEQSVTGILWGMKYHYLLLALALLLLIYETVIVKRDGKNDSYGQWFNVIFAVICMGFGVETSMYDISKHRQILCFITMIIFAACLLIWKPYVSVLILGAAFLYFYSLWYPHLIELDNLYNENVFEGDRINYLIFWIVMVMLSISIYIQRVHESAKDEELIEANEKLERSAIVDDLTGINNLYYFNREAERILKDPETDIEGKVFLFLNVENFKTYNDQFGYQSGNEFLISFARLICEVFPDDLVARQSDDHFVVLTDVEKVREKTEIVRNRVHAYAVEVYLELKVGAFRPKGRDTDPRIAIDSARYACSLTKNRYDRNYKEYNEEVDNRFHKMQYIVNHIDSAVQNGYIKVYYQPVVWADSKDLCGCEALARWIDPTYGFISPGEFIPVLEEYRQIHKLDACIFEQVCCDLRRAMDAGKKVVPVSLNFSRIDFELMDAVGALEKLLEKYGIPKEYIHVEITESALTENIGALEEGMKRFKQDGFSLWLDDFGAGYSSFNVLKDYDFDVLKIDMTFLKGFEKNPKSPLILNAIIRLAESINMFSLTEGVETEEAAEFLRNAGCGRLQGYLFGKPMPVEELEERMTDGTYNISDKLLL
ncbi:MAG: EAL domain-containing protein [Lachnospiraceae bacterium]|nr:EAL domain-containing protein [Lachnospiraceae bacterium]